MSNFYIFLLNVAKNGVATYIICVIYLYMCYWYMLHSDLKWHCAKGKMLLWPCVNIYCQYWKSIVTYITYFQYSQPISVHSPNILFLWNQTNVILDQDVTCIIVNIWTRDAYTCILYMYMYICSYTIFCYQKER